MSFADFMSLIPWVCLGTVTGIVVGSIPGLTGAMVIALALPLTFAMPEDAAFALLVSLYTGSVSGGLIAATLLGIPGTPAAVITTLDAHPMAKRGEPGRALGLAIGASLVGGLFAGACLHFLARPLAEWSTLLGPFDLFALVAVAMVFLVSVSEPGTGGLWRALFSGMAGCLCALPGMHPATGEVRFTLGIGALSDGFKLLPVLVGLFAFSQAVRQLAHPPEIVPPGRQAIAGPDSTWIPWRVWIRQAINLLRSSSLGTIIGILPGIGANIGSSVAYGSARQLSRDWEAFGTGCDEGVVASESANNATVGGALVPLISLGIPGSVIDAILLGAFVIHGLQPGPLLFENHPETVSAIVVSYLLSNLVMAVAMLALARWLVHLARVPGHFLAPFVLVFSVIGCFALANRWFDVGVMIVFGLLGLLFQRLRLPLAPFVIGFVLAPLAEESLSAGLMATGGSYLPLVTRPFSIVCLVLAVVLLITLTRRTPTIGSRP